MRIEHDNDDFYVRVSPHEDDKVWIECGSNWIHYANDNHGFAVISKEEARELAGALLNIADEKVS